MQITLQQITASNTFLKCIALYLGYIIWFAISSYQGATLRLEVPISYYNVPQAMSLHSPETVQVVLHGKKSKLAMLDTKSLAAHINAEKFTTGPQQIIIQDELFLLPTDLKVISYAPHNLLVYGENK